MEPLLKKPLKEDGALRKKFVLNGLRMIHGPEMRDEIIAKMKQGEPAEAIARIGALLLSKMEASAAEQGKPLDDTTKLLGGYELLGELIEVGEMAGVIPKMSDEERQEVQATALSHVVAKVMERDIQSGKINPQELLQVSQEAQKKLGLNLDEGERKIQKASKRAAQPRRGNYGA